VKKGESLRDTIQNIHAMKMDCVVMRHPVPGSAQQLTNYVDSVIVNAGDGTHEHPTQALLDIMSLKEKFGKVDGLKIGIVGDILHSRVALSNIFGLVKLGARVKVCGPPHLIQKDIESLGVNVEYDIDSLIEWADALNILRIQRERMGVGIIPSIREYRKFFGITKDRMEYHKKELVIMHPGPINRGVEIDSVVADSQQALILNQVLNGVAVRMSVLYLLLGNNNLEI
jgi:aspartate carbamoyltransferase catalytic subunit